MLSGASMLATAQTFTRNSNGIVVNTPQCDVTLTLYNPSTARVVKAPHGTEWSKQSLSVTATPEAVKHTVKSSADAVTLTTSNLVATVNLNTGAVSFSDPARRQLIAEKDAPVFQAVDYSGTPGQQVGQTFTISPDEHLYGLGIPQNGKLSQRGAKLHLMPDNTADGIPYVHSSKNYAIFWDNYSPTDFSDTSDSFTFRSEEGDIVDYYFMRGANADGVVAEMRRLTGQVPMMPLWAYGFMQSRERYKTQEEMLNVLRTYRKLNIPIDCMIQDWQYWGNNYLWNAMEFMNPDFDRPQQMIDEVHRLNAKMMISIWSSFGPKTKPYKELDEKGMLFNFATWPQSGISHVWPPRMDYPSGVRVYDAYNPEARDIYWKHLRRIHDMGMDAWWMDSTEPDHFDWKPEDFNTPTHLGTFRKVRGAYPLLTVGGVNDHQLADSANKRVFILTRSAFAGQQRYGCNVWSGDVGSSWESLRKQVTAGLNFSLTGNPNFNSDLGGFFAGSYNHNWEGYPGPKNPAYRELYTRWMQMGVFTPMMRSHGADVPREIYLYGKEGEPIYDAMVEAVRLRYRLLPYIYSTAWDVSKNSSTFLRALFMDFPADTACANMPSEYMFGSQMLVAPVLHATYTPEDNRHISADDGWNHPAGGKDLTGGPVDFTAKGSSKVYLPAGTVWYDFHTGKRYDGGQEISVETTIREIPVFLRGGAILPIGPDVNYSTEKLWDNLTMRVFPGADGKFTLYEDDGLTNDYTRGAHTEIPFSWNDRSRTLTIGKRIGSYPAMLATRDFTIALPDGTTKTVPYSGKQVKVKL